MYKVIYFLLVASISACLYIGASQSKVEFGAVGLLGGPVLTLVWGLWTKAGVARTILATLLSAIPFIGPWIGFLMLVGKTPKYTGKGARIFRWSVLVAGFFFLGAVLLIIRFIQDMGKYSLSESSGTLIPALVLLLLGLVFLFIGDWLIRTTIMIIKFLNNAVNFIYGLVFFIALLILGPALIVGSLINGVEDNWPLLIVGILLVIGDIIFIRWLYKKMKRAYQADQERSAMRAANLNRAAQPAIPTSPVPAGSIPAVELVTGFAAALKKRDQAEQDRLLALQVTCPHCGKLVSSWDAWLVRHNNVLVCPACNQVWT